MKIALIYDRIYPFLKGGAEKRFYEIGRRLVQRGHEVHIYGMKLWEGNNVIYRQGIFYHGICKQKNCYLDNGKRSIWESIYFGINCIKLIKEDFDIIDCSNFPYFSLFSCKLACMLKRKPLYCSWHEVWGLKYWVSYIGKIGVIGYLVEKLAVLMPDKIISVSEHTTNKLINILHSKKDIITITNGIDLKYIQKIILSSTKSDVIFAGRLIEYKNVDILIKAIKIISEKKPEVKCLIIGDGPEKKRLEKIVVTLKLTKNVLFLGFLENQDEVYSLIKSSKVFVLPSTREGFGIVVIEANACGIPVITINHKDNAAKDLIEEGKNGYVCELNEKYMAERILDVFKNSTDEKTKHICVDSARKYDWDQIIEKLEEVYK